MQKLEAGQFQAKKGQLKSPQIIVIDTWSLHGMNRQVMASRLNQDIATGSGRRISNQKVYSHLSKTVYYPRRPV
ncbi:hypothetical protein TNCV_2490281 [Trichonephila clavipes]|nr:hypothetical protein TNCV_2490281 [Trichonephila clavipes]